MARVNPPGYARLRQYIFNRDGECCKVCGLNIQDFEYIFEISGRSYRELGHCVDLAAGGDNAPDNLALMCLCCNALKPVHETIDEYDEWVHSGFWVTDILSQMGLPINDKYRLSVYRGGHHHMLTTRYALEEARWPE